MTPKYLRKNGTSIVLDYSPILAKRKDMVPCDVMGQAIHVPAPAPVPVETYVETKPELPKPLPQPKPKALKKTQE